MIVVPTREAAAVYVNTIPVVVRLLCTLAANGISIGDTHPGNFGVFGADDVRVIDWADARMESRPDNSSSIWRLARAGFKKFKKHTAGPHVLNVHVRTHPACAPIVNEIQDVLEWWTQTVLVPSRQNCRDGVRRLCVEGQHPCPASIRSLGKAYMSLAKRKRYGCLARFGAEDSGSIGMSGWFSTWSHTPDNSKTKPRGRAREVVKTIEVLATLPVARACCGLGQPSACRRALLRRSLCCISLFRFIRPRQLYANVAVLGPWDC